MLSLQGAWLQSLVGGLKDGSRYVVWLKKKGSMKGLKYWGHLPQLPICSISSC